MSSLNFSMKRRIEESELMNKNFKTMDDQDEVFRRYPQIRVFECKTCNRHFSSFQALGGHRASHKKPRFKVGDGDNKNNNPSLLLEHKTHECSICGLGFSIGQALGGHMRRHRNTADADAPPNLLLPNSARVSLVKKANVRRVVCLDLNLPPLEDDLDIQHRGGSSEKLNPPTLLQFL